MDGMLVLALSEADAKTGLEIHEIDLFEGRVKS